MSRINSKTFVGKIIDCLQQVLTTALQDQLQNWQFCIWKQSSQCFNWCLRNYFLGRFTLLNAKHLASVVFGLIVRLHSVKRVIYFIFFKLRIQLIFSCVVKNKILKPCGLLWRNSSHFYLALLLRLAVKIVQLRSLNSQWTLAQWHSFQRFFQVVNDWVFAQWLPLPFSKQWHLQRLAASLKRP